MTNFPLPSTAAALALGFALATGATAPGHANERDKQFFDQVEGNWVGPGEIVAGKYKGTKFTCTFKGASAGAKVGMSLDGGCRVGVFTQKMSAKFQKGGKAGYSGTFMDGAEGKGLNITSGRVEGRKVTLALNRNKLKGAMLARLADENTMNVTVSVRVDKSLVPVIGMSLKRSAGPIGPVASE
jgi:hypothetical protein